MELKDFIWLVNSDLLNEYRHLHTYLHYGVVVSGLHRAELSEFLLKEAASELKHCEEFARKIVGLGGVPKTPWDCTFSIPPYTHPSDILQEVLRMETEVVENFVLRMKQAEELGGADGMTMHVFYENQVHDSRTTVDDVREMLKPGV